MSQALFHATLRGAIRDALAQEAESRSNDAARDERLAPQIREKNRLSRGDVALQDCLGASGRAS